MYNDLVTQPADWRFMHCDAYFVHQKLDQTRIQSTFVTHETRRLVLVEPETNRPTNRSETRWFNSRYRDQYEDIYIPTASK